MPVHFSPRLTRLKHLKVILVATLLPSIQATAQSGTIPVGYGNGTDPSIPLNSCYTYNYSQQIYTAAELSAGSGLAGDITAIRFFHAAGADDAGTGWNDWTVYLGGISQATFSGTSAWVPLSGLQQVFAGTVQPLIGNWMEITLDTPFPWDGVQNIVVAIHEHSPGFGCTAVWKAYDAPDARSLLFRSDAMDPDPSAPPAASMMPSNRLAQVQFVGTVASCLPPSGIMVSGIAPGSFQLTWTDNAATDYEYEVRSSGAPGSGPGGLFATGTVASGSPAIDVQGLVPNTDFSVYVHSNCSGSYSLWSLPFHVHTPCDAVEVPWTEDFSSSTPPALPICFATEQTAGQPWNTTAFALPGMNGNCAHAAYDLITLPDQWLFTNGLNLQAGTNYRLSYQYGSGNADTQDNLAVYLATGSSASDTVVVLALHEGIASANALSNTVDFYPAETRTYYLGFRYFAGPGDNPGQLFLDSIHVELAPSCEPVPLVNAASTASDAGSVFWTTPSISPAGGYDLYYSTDPTPPNDATVPNFSGIADTAQALSGLDEGIPVYAWVRSRCADTDLSEWTGPALFTPGLYQIGEGTEESGSLPVNSCYSYTYSQQIYLASEFNGDPLITHLRFKYLGGSNDPTAWIQWTVYMGNTAQAVFPGSTDWVPYGQLQQVFAGTVAPVPGEWMDITLNAPFLWNGTDNIVVAVDENTDGSSCTANWAAFSPGTARGLLYASDFLNPDPSNPPSASQSPDFTIPQLQLISGVPSPCNGLPAPGATTGPANICPGISFNLGLETVSADSGISYLWQSSLDGITWNDAPGLNTGQSCQASQLADTWYRAQVTCAASGTTASTPLLVTTDPFATCYCQSADFTAQVEPICNVTFAGIDHDSPGEVDSSPGLEDFTAELPAEVMAGADYPISVTGNTNGNFSDRITAFFDWDHDGIFETALSLPDLTNNNCSIPATATVPVPPTAVAGISRMRVMKSAGAILADPCAAYSYGQAEDYLVNVSVPLPCDALPAPGNTTGPASICPDVSFTLGMQNQTAQAGISYQWESSPDGSTWTLVPGNGTQATCSISQSLPTWYRVQVTCDSAGTAASNPLLVGINPPTACYCTSLNFTYQVQPICEVAFAGIDHTSGNAVDGSPGLEDFTNLPPGNVTTGFAYPITIHGHSDITTSQVAVFFDWDQDGVFENVVPVGSITNDACTDAITTTVTVPASAVPGITRMRVLLGDFQVPSDPCGTYSSGQGEDYLLNVSAATPCSALPEPGNTTGPNATCPGEPITLGLSNIQLETGISYQWQSSPDGIAWTNATGNSNGANFTTAISAGTWFRAEVNCVATGSSFSGPLHVQLAPPADCYCTGIAFTATVQPICHVSFADLDHASSSVINGSPAVEDFTSFTASVVQGHAYTLHVSGNAAGGTSYVSAFFDWDGNGVFESAVNAGILMGAACNDTATASITVPAAAATGMFHLRVVMNANNYAADPCGQYAEGQAEDYSLMVNDAIGISELAGADGIRIFPNPARTELFLETTDGTPLDVTVHDLLGHVVLQPDKARKLDVSRLVPGVYVLSVAGKNGNPAHLRFVKE